MYEWLGFVSPLSLCLWEALELIFMPDQECVDLNCEIVWPLLECVSVDSLKY